MRTKTNVLTLFIAILLFGSCDHKKKEYSALIVGNPDKRHLDFPVPLTPETPWDVDKDLLVSLLANGKGVEAQRIFEILSWQWFISLNWPTNEYGEPMSKISDAGNPEWYGWKESYEVFRANGEKPTPWGTFNPPPHFADTLDYQNEKILFRANKFVDFNHPDIEDEIDQAFTGPIWDQNGNITRYEVRMNEVEFDYIVNNDLYNYDGQIVFSMEKGDVVFPEGNRETAGVIEIKVAWKILEDSDIASRYFTTDGYVVAEDGKSYTKEKVGMVGMHISSKTETSPQWIWTTYEHVDNLEVDELVEIDGKPLRASYRESNSIQPVNVFPDTATMKKNGEPFRTQIQRIDPISGATQALNSQVQFLLREAGSKLQYYQQIGTQWPTDKMAPPYTYGATGGAAKDTIYDLPESVTNKSGGKPTPTYLTNMIMETYFQGGTIVGTNDLVVQTFLHRSDANSPYNAVYHDTLGNSTTNPNTGFDIYMTNEPAYFQMNGSPVGYDKSNSHTLIYGTESCIGCHFSSNIATGFKYDSKGNKKPIFDSRPTSADFSWLLNQKPSFLPEEEK